MASEVLKNEVAKKEVAEVAKSEVAKVKKFADKAKYLQSVEPVQKVDFVEIEGEAKLVKYVNKRRSDAEELRVQFECLDPFDKYAEKFLVSIPFKMQRLAGRVDRDFRTVIEGENVHVFPIYGFMYLRKFVNRAERKELDCLDVSIYDPFGVSLLPFRVSDDFVLALLLDKARKYLNVTERPKSSESN